MESRLDEPHADVGDTIGGVAAVGSKTWSCMCAPGSLSVSRFGKSRGERLEAVPEDYLRWLVAGQNVLREEVKGVDDPAGRGDRQPGPHPIGSLERSLADAGLTPADALSVGAALRPGAGQGR